VWLVASRLFDESKISRDDEGKFARKAGGGANLSAISAALGRASAVGPRPDLSQMADNAIRKAAGRGGLSSRPERGMPDAISSSSVPLSGGGDLGVDRHVDGSVSLTSGGRRTTMPKDAAQRLAGTLRLADDWERGDEENIPGVGRLTKVSGGYQLDLPGGNRVGLSRREAVKLDQAIERSDASTRVDTGYGDADVFVADGNKIGFRHLGDDGRPVEVVFNKSSFNKIVDTFNRLVDDIDLDGPDRKPVYSGEFSTNVGRVRVEMTGLGRDPGDRLRIGPAEGDAWGLVVAGRAQDAWYDAMSNAQEQLEWV
jgi:hypothetical protein